MPTLLSDRHYVSDIDLHGCGLPNKTNTQHQAVALLFAQENPVNSLQRTSDHWYPLTTQASANGHRGNLAAMTLANSLKSLK